MLKYHSLPGLDTDSYKPLYIQISDVIIDSIKNEIFKEGGLIPSEHELLFRYQVSRNTVRQAVQLLEKDRWVKRVRGKGTYVTKTKEIKSLDFTMDIESKIAALGKKPGNRLCDLKEVKVMDKWARFLSIPESSPVICLRRVKLADSQPIALEERYFPPEIARLFSTEDLKNTPTARLFETKKKTSIHYVEYLIGNAPLTETEAKNLEIELSASIFRRSSVYYTSNMKPIMASRVTFLAEKIEWRVQLSKSGETWEALSIVN